MMTQYSRITPSRQAKIGISAPPTNLYSKTSKKSLTEKIIPVQNGIMAKPMRRTLPYTPATKALRRRVLPDRIVSNQWPDRPGAPVGTLAHGLQ